MASTRATKSSNPEAAAAAAAVVEVVGEAARFHSQPKKRSLA